MTDREKAIVTAYTGITMLSGEKFRIFHKYIEDILGRPVYTHELAWETVWQQIKDKSKDDFIEICKREDGWIPVSERLPEKFQRVLVTIVNYKEKKVVRVAEYYERKVKGVFQIKENHEEWEVGEKGLLAWKPLPEPYKEDKAESEEDEK